MEKSKMIKIGAWVAVVAILWGVFLFSWNSDSWTKTNGVKTQTGTEVSTGTWVKVPTKSDIKSTKSTIPSITAGWVEFKDIESVKTTNGVISQEIKFIKPKVGETKEQFLTRINKKNDCYLNEYVSYYYDLLNGRGWKVVFDGDISFDYDKEWKIIQVGKVSKLKITQSEYLERNPVYKNELVQRKKMIDGVKDETQRKTMLADLQKELDSIPTEITTENKIDTDVSRITFKDIMGKMEAPENCKVRWNFWFKTTSTGSTTETTSTWTATGWTK